MQNRGYIKWAPFNSIINDKLVVKEILNTKNKLDKPTLSDDQIEYLNEKLFEAYTNHLKVNLLIYINGKIHKLTGFVNNINVNKKSITFNNGYIYFNQIISISDFFNNC